MRIGTFTSTNKRLVLLLCQLAPEDCSYEEENYEGDDPTERIWEIELAGYKVLTVWWKDIKHDHGLFKKIMMDFEQENRSFGMH